MQPLLEQFLVFLAFGMHTTFLTAKFELVFVIRSMSCQACPYRCHVVTFWRFQFCSIWNEYHVSMEKHFFNQCDLQNNNKIEIEITIIITYFSESHSWTANHFCIVERYRRFPISNWFFSSLPFSPALFYFWRNCTRALLNIHRCCSRAASCL